MRKQAIPILCASCQMAVLFLLWMLCVYLQAKYSDKESTWLLTWLTTLKTTLPNALSKSSSDVS